MVKIKYFIQSLEIYTLPIITVCGHTFCNECIENYQLKLNKKLECPLCKKILNKSQLILNKKLEILIQIFLKMQSQKSSSASKQLCSKKSSISMFKNSQQSSSQQESDLKTNCTLDQQCIMYNQPKDISYQINILVSGLPLEFKDEVQQFCQFFGVKQNNQLNQKITHLIVFPEKENVDVVVAKRTVKYLKCLVQGGIWIVSYLWIKYSNFYQRIMEEDQYEVTEDLYGKGASKQCRLQKGLKNIFQGLFFVVDNQFNKKGIDMFDLQDIIKLGGGQIMKRNKKDQNKYFHLLILEDNKNPSDYIFQSKVNSIVVSHKWILDSISHAELLNFKLYQ